MSESKKRCIKLTDKIKGSALEKIKTDILDILEIFDTDVTQKQFTYFFKKEPKEKFCKVQVEFLKQNVMHLLGIQRYAVLYQENVGTRALAFYSDFLAGNINWDSIWIKGDTKGFKEFQQKIKALKHIRSIKEEGVRIGGNGGLFVVRFDNVLYAKKILGLGISEGVPVSSFEKNTKDSQEEGITYKVLKIEIKNLDDSTRKILNFNAPSYKNRKKKK